MEKEKYHANEHPVECQEECESPLEVYPDVDGERMTDDDNEHPVETAWILMINNDNEHPVKIVTDKK